MNGILVLFVFLRGLLGRAAWRWVRTCVMRQQLAVLHRTTPRPKLHRADRLFWAWLSRLWTGWRTALVLVQPETVVRWHRQGFRLFWPWKSRPRRAGRPPAAAEVRTLMQHADRGKPAVGRTTHPALHPPVGARGRRVHRGQVHDAAQGQAAVADLAGHVPAQPRRLPGVDRLLRGADGHLPPAVRLRRAAARPPRGAGSLFQRDGAADGGVGGAGARGVPRTTRRHAT